MAQRNASPGGPSSLTYNAETGVLTINRTSHGLYTGQEVFIVATGRPDFCFYDLPATRVTANQFTVQLAVGERTLPGASTVYIGNGFSLRAENPFNWLSPGRFRVLRNAGVPDETAAQIRARIADSLALRPSVLNLRAGINSYSAGASVASVYADNLAMCQDAVDAGVAVILHTLPPHGAPDAARGTWLVEVNRLLRTIPASVRGVILCDDYAALVDPASPLGAARAGHLNADNLHLSAMGARVLSVPLQTCYDAIYKPLSPLPTSAIEAYDATNNPASKNTFSNGLLRTTSGGTAFTGISGPVAADLSVGRFGAMTGVASVVSAARGFGNAQRVVGTPTADGDGFYVKTLNASSRAVAGERYIFGAHVKTSGVADNAQVKNISLSALMTIDGTSYTQVRTLYAAGAAAAYQQADIDMPLVSDPFVVPAGCTDLRCQVQIDFSGSAASAVTMDVSQVTVERVS
jgi:lysophospholipase L1-like esterase